MEYIPLLGLLLGLGVVSSLAAVVAAFRQQLVARILAALTMSASGGIGLIILLSNRCDLSWLFHVLTTPSPLTLLVWGTALLSLVAAFVPLARRAGDGVRTRTVTRNRWLIGLGVGASVLTLVAFWGVRLIDGERGRKKTESLLAGDRQVRLRRVEFAYQQIRVTCTDPVALRYFEDCLRGPEKPRDRLGTSYEMTLEYESGGRQAFATAWEGDGFSLWLSDDDLDYGIHHNLPLSRPAPPQVEEIIALLTQSGSEARGTVLTVEAGGVRRERDASLVKP